MSLKSVRRVRPRLEELERRLTPSTAALRGGVLVVEGTDQPDVIRIDEQDRSVRVSLGDGTPQVFARSAVTSVQINGRGGNDRITVVADSRLPAFIEGGAGNDVIQGGDGDDEIDGGSGDDRIRGGRGDDLIAGDDGRDVLFGGAGADTVLGGRGNDTVDGGSGADLMDGGVGNDLLRGGDGPDVLNAGTGFNTLVGGNGRDRLVTVDEFEGFDVNHFDDFQPGTDRKKTTFMDPFLMGFRTDLIPGAPSANDRRHLDGPIDYVALGSTNPPTFGPHHPVPLLPTGVRTTPQDDADLVHNMEHGHVRIIYDKALVSAADVAALQRMVLQFGPNSGLILTPRLNNPTPIAATSWAHVITLQQTDLRLLRKFILVNRGYGPEGYITP